MLHAWLRVFLSRLRTNATTQPCLCNIAQSMRWAANIARCCVSSAEIVVSGFLRGIRMAGGTLSKAARSWHGGAGSWYSSAAYAVSRKPTGGKCRYGAAEGAQVTLYIGGEWNEFGATSTISCPCCRIWPTQIGVSDFNRAVSWKHAYYVQKQIEVSRRYRCN